MAKSNIPFINSEGQLVKSCSKCGEIKPATMEFFAKRSDNGNWRGPCRACNSGHLRARYKDNPEKIKEFGLRYYKKHKDKINNKVKEKRAKYPDRFHKYEQTKYSKHKEKIKVAAKEYYWKNRDRVLEYKKEWREEHCDGNFHKKHYEKYKENIAIQSKLSGKKRVLFDTFAPQLTIEELPRRDKDGFLLVLCTYCGRYFYPTRNAVGNRIKIINGKGSGSLRLYCSDGCKSSCSIFGKEKWPKGFKRVSSREVVSELRQMALERDEYECQRCGKRIDETSLHVHHINGATQNKMISNDLWNVITLCKECHKWVHTQEGCGYNDLKCK
jgi:hypothetical protein